MSKIQIDSGQMSSATHRLTQASQTLNRHYVRRPANIAIEEAARELANRENREKNQSATSASPSRLVNLGVSSAALAAAKAEEAAQAQSVHVEKDTFQPEDMNIPASIPELSSYPPESISFTPQVVEFGTVEITAKSERQEGDAESTLPDVAQNNPSATSPDQEIDTATLAMNIAADYAAASLGASIKEFGEGYKDYSIASSTSKQNETSTIDAPVVSDVEIPTSVDAMAQAVANTIASIRATTDPSQISEQIASLRAFAENIKSNSGLPEMKELGDTIDKFISIVMKSTKIQEETKSNAAKVTLSPKVHRAATKVTKSSAKVLAAKTAKTRTNIKTAGTQSAKISKSSTHVAALRSNLTPQELKNRAIEQALSSVSSMDENRATKKKSKPAPTMRAKRKGGVKRFLIAFTCATACAIAIFSFVSSNIPDISVRVAAMQTGISAAYPSYIPRDYTLSNIDSESGKISMLFEGPGGSTFTLVEEKSSWDSSALQRNFVEPNWGEEFTTTHEQGITIYISDRDSDAIWVNSGVLYHITSSGTPLTKKQVRNIVVSL